MVLRMVLACILTITILLTPHHVLYSTTGSAHAVTAAAAYVAAHDMAAAHAAAAAVHAVAANLRIC